MRYRTYKQGLQEGGSVGTSYPGLGGLGLRGPRKVQVSAVSFGATPSGVCMELNHHHHHHIYLFTKWRHITRKKLQLPLGLSPKASKYAIPLKPTHKLAESKQYSVTWWGDSEGPKGHLSLLPPHQVKVKKAASRFSQSATFYDKKFYAKLKQSVAKICTLCTVYTQNSQSTCKENARQH